MDILQEQEQQTLSDLLKSSIDQGAPLFNQGKKKECFETYLDAAKLALDESSVQQSAVVGKLLKAAVKKSLLLEKEQDWSNGAWVLRKCFDDVRKESESQQIIIVSAMKTLAPKHEMESLSQLLTRTINEGAPMYNQGKKKECLELYLETAEFACTQESLNKTAVGELLQQAIEEATELQQQQEWAEGAWVLRHAFDEILDGDGSARRHGHGSSQSQR